MDNNSFALFVDNSGSVGGCIHYWQTVSDIIAEYGKDITHYYLWNSQCHLSSKKEMEQSIESKRGTGGTNPEHVAIEIVAKQFTSIILVTDGEVGDHSVQACDRKLNAAYEANKFKISRAVCYVIGSYSEPNLSVTCPFTRRSESKVFSRTRESPLKTVMQYTQEDYKVLDSLEEISLENFEAKYTSIEQLIIAINMGRDGNPELHSQLVAMKTRLVKELSKKLGK